MAKLKSPLFGFLASGSLGKFLTFRRRSNKSIAEHKPRVPDVKSLAQMSWRSMYLKAVALWHALSPAEKLAWENSARPHHMIGFAYFMSSCLKPNPGVYLPLVGGSMQGDIIMSGFKITGLPAPSIAGEPLRKGTALTITEMPANMKTAVISFIIDGGGVITTGEKGHLEIPFACTIARVTTLSDQSGSIVVDIWKDSYANFPPTNADSITSSTPPTLSSSQKSQDSTLTGWSKSIAAGSILAFNVDSITTIERVLISLKVTKT